MYVDFPDELKDKCQQVTPRRELMAYQLVPGVVMYAHGKNKIYRPHPTHRFKATLFLWEANDFEQDFRPAVEGDSGYEPIVMAEKNGDDKPAEKDDAAVAAAKTPPPEPEKVTEPEVGEPEPGEPVKEEGAPAEEDDEEKE